MFGRPKLPPALSRGLVPNLETEVSQWWVRDCGTARAYISATVFPSPILDPSVVRIIALSASICADQHVMLFSLLMMPSSG